ncbi:MAG TPA: hypothetical protein VMV22_14775 [Acidimicrobiales bacterium]|nr:hypothetical protein [Acidimicrobiales bacterium]
MVQDAPDGPGPVSDGPDDTDREPFLRRVLDDFEAGRIAPYDYTRRVMAINAATSTGQMAAIADQAPEGSAGGPGPSSSLPGLDAVDLALLHRQHQQPAGRSGGPGARYVTLAVVFVLFAVLIAVGMWLASHTHAVSSNPSGTMRGIVAMAVDLRS